jgi:hypothetical protein
MQKKANALLVITPIYGLPEILPLLSRVDAVRGTYSTMPMPQPLHNILYITLVAQIESNIEWPTPTNDVRPIVTEPLEMVALWSQNQWIQSPHITHTFDHNMQSI